VTFGRHLLQGLLVWEMTTVVKFNMLAAKVAKLRASKRPDKERDAIASKLAAKQLALNDAQVFF
jgi:hypothetical protein